ncbi:MAG: phospholipase D family protein [Chitinophagales bacterium]
MEINFIGQGLPDKPENSAGNVIMNTLKDTSFESFLCIVAFASKKGVGGLRKLMETNPNLKTTIYVGIDQQGTPKEALEELLSIRAKVAVYYTNSPIIFHPKLYLFEGKEKCRVIVGSSNLTVQGLFRNLEASLVVDFEVFDVKGRLLLQQIKSYYKDFLSGEDVNIQGLSHRLINNLYEAGIVPNEEKVKASYRKTPVVKSENQSIIKEIKELFPAVKLSKVPDNFVKKLLQKKKQKVVEEASKVVSVISSPINKGNLVWRKIKLPGSDVQYSREGTNPTGGLRLTQAKWQINGEVIDQTSYFRNTLWGKFEWGVIRAKPLVERAIIQFSIKINGEDKGIHTLEVRHKPSGVANQGNYTTSLSWGSVGDIIKNGNLKGKDLFLYAPSKGRKEPFFIEIH